MKTRISNMWVSNFRSLGDDVHIGFGDFTALVGPNGSGKSNVLDSLRFLRDALTVGLEPALTQRLGIERLRRASPRGARDVVIYVQVEDEENPRSLQYYVIIKSLPRGRYQVNEEALMERPAGAKEWQTLLRVEKGVLRTAPAGLSPTVDKDELAILGIAAHPSVRPLVDTIREVRIHSLYPKALSEPQSGGAPPPLDDSGSNWCSVLRSLSGTAKRQLADAMNVVLDDVTGVSATASGGYYTATFTHRLSNGDPRAFAAAQESDGTLRLAGLLTALLQDELPPLLGIEEPELTINPGLLPLLFDHIKEAATKTQVVITTHSPDLLDLLAVDDIRVVQRREGMTGVGRVSAGQVRTVKQGLLAPGELLRSGGLTIAGDATNLLDDVDEVPDPKVEAS